MEIKCIGATFKLMEYEIRLTHYQRTAICEAFKNHFGLEDHLWIFGSRTQINKKGGDIDLYIETLENDPDRVVKKN